MRYSKFIDLLKDASVFLLLIILQSRSPFIFPEV